jgi:uncharacterized Fe-S cluster-containing radical SAM superfamily protein
MPINTPQASARYRPLLIDVPAQRVRITNYHNTDQEPDLREPANCRGFGRIRHFSRQTTDGWVPNPLPIDPASRALGLGRVDHLRAQVFQNAGCNWRCWYCFVPFDLLSANPNHSDWLTVSEMLDMFLAQRDRPSVIDLSGGEPGLTPEWVIWVLEELRHRGLDRECYVWSDDNLSTDYFWTLLQPSQQELVATSRNYGRVGCFKGIDRESFTYNTGAVGSNFDMQFDFMQRFISSGVDVYAYVTFTMADAHNVRDRVSRFVDRLQDADDHLPLRTVPLEVQLFTPVRARLHDRHRQSLKNQWIVLEAWRQELEQRFSSDLRAQSIADVGFVTRS